MNRRDVLRLGVGAALGANLAAGQDEEPASSIMTVLGPIVPAKMGVTLPHEHLLVDFIGAEQASPARYDRPEVVKIVLPHLRRIKELGCATLVECTPAFLARDPIVLKELSQTSGLNLLTNTGLYAANGGKHLPAYAKTESPDELAKRWLKEWTDGIGESGVQPGFIKIGVDAGPLNAMAKKVLSTAAIVHKASGLTIASHTGDGQAAVEQLEGLVAAGVSPHAWIWVHAQNETTKEVHLRAADLGGWIEFDGIAPTTIDRYATLVESMKRAKMLNRVLLSHDAGWYHVGEKGGGTFRPFDTLFQSFLPELKRRGFSDEEVQLLTIDNPREAFTIHKRVL